MRITLLSLYYPPEPCPKMHVLAHGFQQRGHHVKVITGFPNYPKGRTYPGYRQTLWHREQMDGVRLLRLPVFPDHSASAMRRTLNDLSFALSTSLVGPFLSGPSDLIFVYSPPMTLGIAAALIGSTRGARVVLEIQDLWPDILQATGMITNRNALQFVDWCCKVLYKSCHAITVDTPGYKKALVGRGVPPDKVHVVPNWAYEGDFEPAQADKALADRLGFTGKFNVLYAGIMGPAQGLHNVLDAAGRLSHIKELQFVFLGDGIERPRLQNIAAQRNLRNVTFIDRVPISVMPSVYASVDALLVHLTDDPHFEITIPGKTQSYLASGRPIVVSVAGDATDLVLQARAGIAARPMDPDDLARAVRELWSLGPDRRLEMGRNGRAYYTEHLSPPVLIEKYVQLFQDTCRSGEAAEGDDPHMTPHSTAGRSDSAAVAQSRYLSAKLRQR